MLEDIQLGVLILVMIVNQDTIVREVLTGNIVEQETIVREVFDQLVVQVSGRAVLLSHQIHNVHNALKVSSMQVLHSQVIHVKYVQQVNGQLLVHRIVLHNVRLGFVEQHGIVMVQAIR